MQTWFNLNTTPVLHCHYLGSMMHKFPRFEASIERKRTRINVLFTRYEGLEKNIRSQPLMSVWLRNITASCMPAATFPLATRGFYQSKCFVKAQKTHKNFILKKWNFGNRPLFFIQKNNCSGERKALTLINPEK